MKNKGSNITKLLAQQALKNSGLDSSLDKIFGDTSNTLFEQFSFEKKAIVLNKIKEVSKYIENVKNGIQIFLNEPTDNKDRIELKNAVNESYKKINSIHTDLKNMLEKNSSLNEDEFSFNENMFNQNMSEFMEFAQKIYGLIE